MNKYKPKELCFLILFILIINLSCFTCIALADHNSTNKLIKENNDNNFLNKREILEPNSQQISLPVPTGLSINNEYKLDTFIISWNNQISAEIIYLYRSNSEIQNSPTLSPYKTLSYPSNSFSESNLPPGLYYYALKCSNGASNSSLSICEFTEVADYQEGYAICVGVSDYPGTSNDLQYCDDDAIDMKAFFKSQFNLVEENIITLTNSQATTSAITNAINSMATKMDQNDYLIFQYSGHGSSEMTPGTQTAWSIQSPHNYPNNYDVYWHYYWPGAKLLRVHFVRVDVEPGYDAVFIGDNHDRAGTYDYYTVRNTYNFWSAWVPSDDIYVELYSDYIYTYWGFQVDYVQIGYFANPYSIIPYDGTSDFFNDYELDSALDVIPGKVISILDSCNSGGVGNMIQQNNRYSLTACRNDEFSMEDSTNHNGAFTYQFLNSWTGVTDANSDGVLSFEEVFSNIYDKTVARTTAMGYVHHPVQYDNISNQVILQTNGKIMGYDTDPSGDFNVTVARSGLGFGEFRYTYYDILNQNYSVNPLEKIPYYDANVFTLNISAPMGFTNPAAISFDFSAKYRAISENNYLPYYFGSLTFNISDDWDNDQISDLHEFIKGLNPWNFDTDFDSMSDSWELNNNFDPMDGRDNTTDSDGDGLRNFEEYVYDTNPHLSDTDEDQLNDYLEVQIYQSDPLVTDTDGDGLIDGQEVNYYNSNPILIDTDNDGLNDYLEVMTYHTNPDNPDSDGDLFTDIVEIQFNTDPLNAANCPIFYVFLISIIISSVLFVSIGSTVLAKRIDLKRNMTRKSKPAIPNKVNKIPVKSNTYQPSYGNHSYNSNSYGSSSYLGSSYGTSSYSSSYGNNSYKSNPYSSSSYSGSSYGNNSYKSNPYSSNSYSGSSYGNSSYSNNSYESNSKGNTISSTKYQFSTNIMDELNKMQKELSKRKAIGTDNNEPKIEESKEEEIKIETQKVDESKENGFNEVEQEIWKPNSEEFKVEEPKTQEFIPEEPKVEAPKCPECGNRILRGYCVNCGKKLIE